MEQLLLLVIHNARLSIPAIRISVRWRDFDSPVLNYYFVPLVSFVSLFPFEEENETQFFSRIFFREIRKN